MQRGGPRGRHPEQDAGGPARSGTDEPEASPYFQDDLPPPRARNKRRRALWATGVAIVLLAGLIAALTIRRAPADAAPAVAVSVGRAIASRTALGTLSVVVDSAEGRTAGAGTADLDFALGEMSAQVVLDDDGENMTLNERYVRGEIFEQIPGLSDLVPGKSWVSVELSDAAQITGGRAGGFAGGGNPTAMLALLTRRGDKARSTGPTSIDGVQVTGYRIKLNPSVIDQELSTAALPQWTGSAMDGSALGNTYDSVFVDKKGELREFAVHSVIGVGPERITIDESLDLSEYGTAVTVIPPPPAEVVGIRQLLAEHPETTLT